MDDFPNLVTDDEDVKQVFRELRSLWAKDVMESGAFLCGPIGLEYMSTASSDSRTPSPVPRVTSRTSPVHSILPGTSSARRNNSGPSRTRGHRIKRGPSLKRRPKAGPPPNGIKERRIRNPILMQGLSLTNIMEPVNSPKRRIKQGPSVSRKTKQGTSISRKTKQVPSSSQMVDMGTPRNRRVKPARGPSRRYKRRASPAGGIRPGPSSGRRVKQLPSQARRIEQWKSLFRRVKQELSSRRVEQRESRASTTWPNELPPLPTYSELYPPEWRPQGKEQIPPIANKSQSADLPMRNQNESAQRETSAQPRRSGEDKKDLTDASLSGASGSGVSNAHDEMSSPITSRNGVNYEPPCVPAQGTSRNGENCEAPWVPAQGTSRNGVNYEPPWVPAQGTSRNGVNYDPPWVPAQGTSRNGVNCEPPCVPAQGTSRNGVNYEPPCVPAQGTSRNGVNYEHPCVPAQGTSRNGVNYEPPWEPAQGTSRNGVNCEPPWVPAQGTSRNGVNCEPPWVPAQGTSRSGVNCELQGLPTPKATGGRNEDYSPVDESPAPRQTRRRRQRRQPGTPSYRDRSELLRSESPRLTDMECPICLGPFGSWGRQFLACAHGFHENCLNKWLKRDRSCPVCRFPVLE